MNEDNNNIAEGNHREILKNLRAQDGDFLADQFVLLNMEKILIHYIGCTWGVCYNLKFKDLIKPYFDDVELLDKLLRSNIIKDRANVIIGKSGARIFDSLLFELRQCDSFEIRQYLIKEFY